jgi:hypothetical protein
LRHNLKEDDTFAMNVYRSSDVIWRKWGRDCIHIKEVV